jgi:prenyltransferase beta subunit
MKLEGGFQGRTNKLVDGCYSFWQGGVFPLLHNLITNEGYPQYLFQIGLILES